MKFSADLDKKALMTGEERALLQHTHSAFVSSTPNIPATVVIDDYQDSQTYGTVQFGTPQQELHVIYGPASSKLWVSNIKPSILSLSKHSYYKHGDSPTYVQNGTNIAIRYGSGPVAGEYSADTMSIGGVDILGYNFAEADDLSRLSPAYGVGKFDGICGKCYDDISVDGVQTPLRALG